MQPLSSQQVDEFFDRGFIVIRRLFSPDDIRQMAKAFDQLRAIAQDFEGNVEHNGSLFKVKRLTREDGSEHRQIHLIAWCGATCPTLLQFGADERLLSIASQLLGSDKMTHLTNQAHFKEPGDGIVYPFHQDSTHRGYGTDRWQDVNGRGSFVQMTTLIDPMTHDNGPLVFIPESCRHGHLGLEWSDTGWPDHPAISEAGKLTITGDPGDVVAFGPYTIHGSRANESNSMRRVFINGYAYPGASRREYTGEGAGRPLCFQPSKK